MVKIQGAREHDDSNNISLESCAWCLNNIQGWSFAKPEIKQKNLLCMVCVLNSPSLRSLPAHQPSNKMTKEVMTRVRSPFNFLKVAH